jgi:hypothetical protein
MSNDANRTLIVLVAAAWIVLMAVLIFLTWSADTDVIDRIGDFQEYLADHNDDPGKLIVTLGALVTVVLALLVIIVEVAPEDEERELRVEQAGATTIVPASALRQRLEEAVMGVPQVTAARARVSTKDKGIVAALDLTLLASANVAAVTQEATRIVVDTVQTDLGLPVVGVPSVKIAFAKGAPAHAAYAPREPAAQPETPPAPATEERVDEWFGGSPPPEEPQPPEEAAPPPPAERAWSPPPAEPAPGPAQPPPAPESPWSAPPQSQPESPPAEQPREPENPQP